MCWKVAQIVKNSDHNSEYEMLDKDATWSNPQITTPAGQKQQLVIM
jgi:hypothetical protein